jgi:hypothetical protein
MIKDYGSFDAIQENIEYESDYFIDVFFKTKDSLYKKIEEFIDKLTEDKPRASV